MESDFCRDSYQKDSRQIPTNEIIVGQKKENIFSSSKWWLRVGTGCPERL